MSAGRGLTDKQQLFCYEYVKCNFNAPVAYRKAYPNIKTDGAASAAATRLLKNVNVKKEIERIKQKVETKVLVTVEDVIRGIQHTIERALEVDQHSAVMKGYDLLGKHLAMYTEKQKVEHTNIPDKVQIEIVD